MKNISFILLVTLFLSSCNSDTGNVDKNPSVEATPTTLNEEYSNLDFRSFSKRSGNLVDRLTDEARNKNKALDLLMNRIETIDSYEEDNLDEYSEFINNNRNYWRSALGYINQISDSTTKHELESLITKYKKEYSQKISAHQSAVQQIEAQKLQLKDQKILLKILVTIPMINNYQKNELPDINSLKKVNKAYDSLNNDINYHVDHLDQ